MINSFLYLVTNSSSSLVKAILLKVSLVDFILFQILVILFSIIVFISVELDVIDFVNKTSVLVSILIIIKNSYSCGNDLFRQNSAINKHPKKYLKLVKFCPLAYNDPNKTLN